MCENIMIINIFTLFLLQICATGVLCQKIIVQPENATGMYGDNIIIRCEFDKPVMECLWFSERGKLNVSIGRYHQYADNITNGRNTRDCSLLIKKIEYWGAESFVYCSNAQSLGKQSNKAYVTVVYPKLTVNPPHAIVVEGDDIALQCELDAPILYCGWMRNGSTVKIEGRYQYTGECSILIKTFEQIDGTYWECFAKSQSGYFSKSKPVYLITATMLNVHPKNATVLEGDDIVLRCKFNKVVHRCAWFRNGSAIEMTDRYRYDHSDDDGSNTNDCSIIINKFSKTDATSWQCFSALNCDNETETCSSNPTYLTIADPETRDKSNSIHNDDASCFKCNSSAIIIIILSTILVIIIIAAVVIYFRRRSTCRTTSEASKGPSDEVQQHHDTTEHIRGGLKGIFGF